MNANTRYQMNWRNRQRAGDEDAYKASQAERKRLWRAKKNQEKTKTNEKEKEDKEYNARFKLVDDDEDKPKPKIIKKVSTEDQTKDAINRLSKAIEKKPADDDDYEWLYKPEVTEYIEEKYKNLNTKRTYYSHIVAYLRERDTSAEGKEAIDYYRGLMYNYIDEVKHEIDKNEKNEDDNSKMFNWNDLVVLKKNRPLNPLDNAVYALYTQLPPRRNEYSSMKIINYKSPKQISDLKEGNWLVMTREGKNIKDIVLNDYKTFKTYGRYKPPSIPKPLKDALRKYIETHSLKAGDELFKGYDTSDSWTKLVQSVFKQVTGNSCGVSCLRKSYVSSKLKNKSVAERREKARQMGTSLNQTDTAYTKID